MLPTRPAPLAPRYPTATQPCWDCRDVDLATHTGGSGPFALVQCKTCGWWSYLTDALSPPRRRVPRRSIDPRPAQGKRPRGGTRKGTSPA